MAYQAVIKKYETKGEGKEIENRQLELKLEIIRYSELKFSFRYFLCSLFCIFFTFILCFPFKYVRSMFHAQGFKTFPDRPYLSPQNSAHDTLRLTYNSPILIAGVFNCERADRGDSFVLISIVFFHRYEVQYLMQSWEILLAADCCSSFAFFCDRCY